MNVYEGDLAGSGLRVGIVASRFNDAIVAKLVDGAVDALRRHGVDPSSIQLAWVPGAFELPLAASRMASSGTCDAVVVLGAVIKGATGHYDFVAGQCAAGIQRVALDTGVPVVFGVLTTDTIEQAIERSGAKMGNKGFESACSAIEMANLLNALPKPTGFPD